MGDLQGKVILEYGCSVGTLTRKLAPRVTETGKIIAADLSLHKVKIADRRTKHLSHVKVHHHPHVDKVKLPIKKVDGVISIGMLSYMQKPKQMLKTLNGHLKKNGEILFVDFDNFFFFIPNVKWIENDQQLKEVFKTAGFSVEVERKQSLLWQYIIIRGKKV